MTWRQKGIQKSFIPDKRLKSIATPFSLLLVKKDGESYSVQEI